MTEPLGPLDALFLHMEDGVSHMHIGSCSIFAAPPPSIDDLMALVRSKLPVLTRYRQKVRFVPAGLGHPVWVDDPHFNLSYHVRHSALPPPGDGEALESLVGRLMSQELDRHRPLWELWMIEGLADGRWALIAKVHHCMVDGISGTDLMAQLLDTDPKAATGPTQAWTPRPEPSDLQLTLDAFGRMITRPMRKAMAWRPRSGQPGNALAKVGEVAAGLRSLSSRVLIPAKQVSLEGSIGPHRRWAPAVCSLGDAKFIREALGGSVNDVVLTAITGAFRSLLLERGEDVEGVVLRSLVPVSRRRPGDHTWNNQVSLILADLPVSIADPVERLQAVREQMATLKESHQVNAGEAVVAAAEFLPPALLAVGAQATAAVMRRSPQRVLNTVTTNVPGPQQPLYALGREMIEYMPYVPLSQGVRIGIAILSYNGKLTFGITGDYDTAPDVRHMAAEIENEMNVLRARAGRRRKPATGRRLEEVS